jgi:hypothetical protein
MRRPGSLSPGRAEAAGATARLTSLSLVRCTTARHHNLGYAIAGPDGAGLAEPRLRIHTDLGVGNPGLMASGRVVRPSSAAIKVMSSSGPDCCREIPLPTSNAQEVVFWEIVGFLP